MQYIRELEPYFIDNLGVFGEIERKVNSQVNF